MKKVFKVLGIVVLLLIVFVGAMAVYVQTSYDKRYNDVPYPDIHASKDSAVVARGKYLVTGPAHCAVCHSGNGMQMDVDAGKQVPLSGGWELNIPPGIFRSRNLTSDKETGIGKLTDGEIARTLRYNVRHDGKVVIDVMPFQNMSDYDLTAVISYLRTLPPVHNEVKPTELSFIGKAVYMFNFKPKMPEKSPVAKMEKDSTIEYGKYMATCVANCYGCHTDRDLRSGKFTGKPFAGGFQMPPDANSNGYTFVTPNLTPDTKTGRLTGWNETVFINRFRQGRIQKGSPMPWGPFSKMDDVELKAIYRYLQTLDGVPNAIEKTAYAPGETLPPPIEWKD